MLTREAKDSRFLNQFSFEALTGFGYGGRGDSQQNGLLGYGELQVREDIGADIALCQVRMRFSERFGHRLFVRNRYK